MIAPQNQPSFYIAGGTLPREAPSYVTRQADAAILDALKNGEFCYVLTARQMGKSSLMVRTAQRLRQEGVAVAVLDLTAFGTNLTPEQWYDLMQVRVGRELDREDELDDFWQDNRRLAPLARFLATLRQVVLPSVGGSVVLLVDEIDVVRSLPFSADEFFAAIRSLYNERDADPALKRLTFGLFGVAAPSDLIADARITPFNIGRRIVLSDFAPAEATPLAANIGTDGSQTLERVLYWTNGHPYLTQRVCQAATEIQNLKSKIQNSEVDALVHALFLSEGARETEDNLKFVGDRLLRSGVDIASLLDLYGKVLAGRRVPDDETDKLVETLRLSGIVRVERGVLKVRNRIYAEVFNKAWIDRHTSDAEKRRQRDAYRKGFFRTLAVSSVIVVLVLALAVSAFWQADRANRNAEKQRIARNDAEKNARERTVALQEAREQRDIAEHFFYIADMNLIPIRYENGDMESVLQLLQETEKSQFRNFEWGYWHRLCHLDLHTLNCGSVTAVAFSPDSKRIVTANYEDKVQVWDARTGCELLTFRVNSPSPTPNGPLPFVSSIAFSPDGKYIVTRNNYPQDVRGWKGVILWDDRAGDVEIWDSRTGEETLFLKAKEDQVYSVALSSEGKRILKGEEKTTGVWKVHVGLKRPNLKGDKYRGVVFSSDGNSVITVSQDTTAQVWNVQTGRARLTLRGHSNGIYTEAFSPDGKCIVTGSGDNTAKIWDSRTGKELLTLKGHKHTVTFVKFSPDSKRIVTCCENIVKVWDARTGQEQLTFRGHTGNIDAVAFSPDGTRIVTGGLDNTAKIWDIQKGYETLSTNKEIVPIAEMSYSNDKRRVEWSPDSETDHTASVLEVQTGKKVATLKGHTGMISSAAISPDGKRVVTTSFDDTTRMWDAQTGHELFRLKEGGTMYSCLLFSPDGKHFATCGFSSPATIWDSQTGKKWHTFGKDMVEFVAFLPDGERIVTGSQDKTAKIWDIRTEKSIVTFKGHTAEVKYVTLSPDGKRVLTGSEDKTAKIWDTQTGRELLTLKGHKGGVLLVAFSPDGKRIVTSNEDGPDKIWFSDVEDAKAVFNQQGATQP